MSKSLKMFSLCHIPLVDLGQHFLCNLAVITKAGCRENRGSNLLLKPDWKSFDPGPVPLLIVLSAEETLLSHVYSAL